MLMQNFEIKLTYNCYSLFGYVGCTRPQIYGSKNDLYRVSITAPFLPLFMFEVWVNEIKLTGMKLNINKTICIYIFIHYTFCSILRQYKTKYTKVIKNVIDLMLLLRKEN
jgi:hypothetical protein